jgi:NADPH:quinone reductase-like Zn-dependent oxidoreductase
MRAIVVSARGRVDIRRDVNPGPLAAGRVRVRVRYAGVGFADLMALKGGYPLAPRMPFSPGYEFFGRIEGIGGIGAEAGSEAPRPGLRPGTRVAGVLPRMGAYRELVDVDPRLVVPVPDALGDESAAAIPLNYLTALAMIERAARLEKGGSFLVHGAAGGVGTAALELARVSGLRAYGSASAPKRSLVSALGGIALSREGGAWLEELHELEPDGVDAAFDAFGLPSFRKSWRALSPKGRLVCYGIARGPKGGYPDFIAGLAYLGARALAGRGRGVRIVSLPRTAAGDPDWCREALSRIFGMAAEGKLSPIVARSYAWDRAGEALEALAAGSVKGKLLLELS